MNKKPKNGSPWNQKKVVRQVRAESKPLLLTDDPLTIGQQVQLIRAARGWSVDKLADDVGVHRGVLDRLEGDAGNQSINLLSKVASQLGAVIIIAPMPTAYTAPVFEDLGLAMNIPDVHVHDKPFRARPNNAAAKKKGEEK